MGAWGTTWGDLDHMGGMGDHMGGMGDHMGGMGDHMGDHMGAHILEVLSYRVQRLVCPLHLKTRPESWYCPTCFL
jgi:hypothetical protein